MDSPRQDGNGYIYNIAGIFWSLKIQPMSRFQVHIMYTAQINFSGGKKPMKYDVARTVFKASTLQKIFRFLDLF